MTTVYVCPDRDIECGSYPLNWCAKCPKRGGTVLTRLSPEQRSELTAALANKEVPSLMGFKVKIDPAIPDGTFVFGPPVVHAESRTEVSTQARRASALVQIREVLNGDQDGVLARIRKIVHDCP
jgi:hypothetical protein